MMMRIIETLLLEWQARRFGSKQITDSASVTPRVQRRFNAAPQPASIAQ
jgi:hypothetical protein